MKKIALLAASVVSLGLLMQIARSLGSSQIYAPDAVKILAEGISEHGLELIFRPLAETTHYCPGANFTLKGSTIHYELVRARVGDEPPVDVPAIPEKSGGLRVTFPFPNANWQKGDVVELVDSAGEHYGPWEHAGISAEPAAVVGGDEPPR